MAVRRQVNRYKTEPFGTDYEDVLKRAKAFFKDGVFYMTEYKGVYTASRPSTGFNTPSNSVCYEKHDRRWVRK